MLDFICYLLSLIFAALAFLAPPLPVSVDRMRLLAAAFGCFVIPFLVEAAKAL